MDKSSSVERDERVERLGVNVPGANMYGCTPCPKCGSEYRIPYTDKHPQHPSMIVCDDCGYQVRYVTDDDF